MIDSADDIVQGASLRADICIVGGGPAGITLALRLAGCGKTILLLESGLLVPDKDAQSLNQGERADVTQHSPPDTYRPRCLGGGTAIWGGRCVPFDPIDFDARPWIPHSGWPIGFDHVERYYPEANALCEAGEYEYDARLAVPGGMRPLLRGFTPAHFDVNRIERFSCPTNFGIRYQARLRAAQTVRVLIGATVTHLQAAPDGARIDSLDVRSRHGTAFTVTADLVVLAMGGMEIPRLLLTSNDVHPAGIGNANDLVGRFYMCHIAGTVGSLRMNVASDAIWHGYDIAPDGTYCRRRLALRPDAQATHALGNAIFRLHHPRIPDPAHRTGPLSAIYLAQALISYEYARRLATDTPPTWATWARHGLNAATDPIATVRFLTHWLRHRILAERKFPTIIVRPRTNRFSLDFHAEQIPNPHSRITLGTATDRFGNRQLRVDWRPTAQDIETISRSLDLLRQDLARHHIATLALAHGEPSIEAVLCRDGAYGGHHIGTARMGASPATGVIDGNGKVFGVNNLFVAGSAAFPTSGQANPTMTIVATALRLADRLAATANRPLGALLATPYGAAPAPQPTAS